MYDLTKVHDAIAGFSHITSYTQKVDPSFFMSEIETKWRGLPVLVSFRCWSDDTKELDSVYVLDRDYMPLWPLEVDYVSDTEKADWEELV